ncbi:MAG TPA: hypothetical protein VHE35_29365, partial [Kofleriaceae bacterium]|nr:hypothetical protein [Kofleriaceae bacterium]
AGAGATTMSVAALDEQGQPVLSAAAAAVLDDLAADAGNAATGGAPRPAAGRMPPTGYMPAFAGDRLRRPSGERWRWLPTRSVAGTIALLLFLFAAAVAIAYVASG